MPRAPAHGLLRGSSAIGGPRRKETKPAEVSMFIPALAQGCMSRFRRNETMRKLHEGFRVELSYAKIKRRAKWENRKGTVSESCKKCPFPFASNGVLWVQPVCCAPCSDRVGSPATHCCAAGLPTPCLGPPRPALRGGSQGALILVQLMSKDHQTISARQCLMCDCPSNHFKFYSINIMF